MEEVTNTSLTLSRVYKTTPEELWEIWTDPAKISQWHRPNRDDYTTTATADLRVGGAYTIIMKQPSGTHVVDGTFKELDLPRKLVYSWEWASGGESSEVSVEFKPVDDGTELTLTHTRLSGPESVASHKAGWIGCLDNIEVLVK